MPSLKDELVDLVKSYPARIESERKEFQLREEQATANGLIRDFPKKMRDLAHKGETSFIMSVTPRSMVSENEGSTLDVESLTGVPALLRDWALKEGFEVSLEPIGVYERMGEHMLKASWLTRPHF